MSGCRAKLGPDQWWTFCGETDMGQTAPALCTECGGPYIRADVGSKTMMNERAVDTVTGKDPGEAHFHLSLVKSGFRIIGCALLIILGFLTDEPLLSYGAGMFFVAEVLGMAEELV